MRCILAIKQNILIVSHEASLTGAPLVAWRMAELLNKDFNVGVVYLSSGILLNQKKHTSKTFLFTQRKITLKEKILRRINKSYSIIKYNSLDKIVDFAPDLICINSICSISFLLESKMNTKKVILYVHEMPSAIIKYFKLKGYEITLFDKLDFSKILVVNTVIKEFLINEAGVLEGKINVLEPSIEQHYFLPRKLDNVNFKYDIIINGLGGWVKGTDLLPHLAFYLKKVSPKNILHIAWVGLVDQIIIDQVEEELRLSKIDSVNIYFLGVQLDIKKILEVSKIFISLSRADAMPTACIEAMAVGLPILCFRGSGGIQRLVDDGAGFSFDYPDFNTMAIKINELLEHKDIYERYSKSAIQISQYYSIDKIGIRVNEIFHKVLK